jgi:hypothetical protein
MNDIFNELIAPSGQYKAIITKTRDGFQFDVYLRSGSDGDVKSCEWLKQNDKTIFIDKSLKAEYFAIEAIRSLLGEPATPLTIDWVRDFSFCETADFLNPQEIKVFYKSPDSDQPGHKSPVEAETVIVFGGQYLVKEVGKADDWLIGDKDREGNINCWCYFGTLTEAIRGL